ncbi:unnamed protein product [Diatraea saccharalis]|uniref:Uncharacterized protein n=1 Tax=Diatraea saccharalis TaxID=40085 RepID=A0A9N9R0Y9_9NEOP|nr:unnamed protein product [Diatraea saccharalis]
MPFYETEDATTRTSRSSTQLPREKLAAEAQHKRHLAQLEMTAMRAQIELERQAAEAEHQAELEAIEAEYSDRGSRRSERSHADIEQWLRSIAPSTTSHRDREPYFDKKILRSDNDGRRVGTNNHLFLCSQDTPKKRDDNLQRYSLMSHKILICKL